MDGSTMTHTKGWITPIWLPLLTVTAFLLVGCDNTLEPFAEKGAYSVYGYLGVNRTDQLVRVKPLPTPITQVGSRPLDATVTLENLDSDTSVTLQDSISVFQDANARIFTHNFWTDLPVTTRTKYRLTVDGPEGSVQATTVTPIDTEPEVIPQTGGCREEITVEFRDMGSRRRHRAWVGVKPPDTNRVYYYQYDSAVRGYDFGLYNTEEGWLALTFIPENLVEGLPNLDLPELPPDRDPRCWEVNYCAGLKTTQMQVWYEYLGPTWYGDIPEDSLTYDPLKSHDVANGLGFFGSLKRDWVPFNVTQVPKFYFTGARGCQRPPDS